MASRIRSRFAVTVGTHFLRHVILGYQQPGQKFIVGTDASSVGIVVLSQVQKVQERVVAYFSKIARLRGTTV